jgi:hypothetical protein
LAHRLSPLARAPRRRQQQQQQQPASRALGRSGSGQLRRQHSGAPHPQLAAPKPPPPAPAPALAPAKPPAPAPAPPQPPPPLLSEHIAPLAEAALLHPTCKEARQQAAAALQLLHPARAELLPVLQRLLPRACGAGKAAKQYFTLLEECLEPSATFADAAGSPPAAARRSAGGGGAHGRARPRAAAPRAPPAPPPPAARQAALEAVGAELRALTQRLLLQQGVEAAGLVSAGPQSFTLGRLVQLLQAGLDVAGDAAGGAAAAATALGVGDVGGGLPPPGEQRALLHQVLWASAALDALSVGRGAATRAAARQLEGLLRDFWGDGAACEPAGPGCDGDGADGTRWEVARALVELLESLQAAAAAAGSISEPDGPAAAGWLQHMAAPLLARLAACVCPERAAPIYMLQLIKAASQTDVGGAAGSTQELEPSPVHLLSSLSGVCPLHP